MRRVRATTVVAMENNQYYTTSVCVIVAFRYPAWKAHVSYRHLWPAPKYNNFLHYLKNGTIFKKKTPPNHTSLNENYVVPCICLRAI